MGIALGTAVSSIRLVPPCRKLGSSEGSTLGLRRRLCPDARIEILERVCGGSSGVTNFQPAQKTHGALMMATWPTVSGKYEVPILAI